MFTHKYQRHKPAIDTVEHCKRKRSLPDGGLPLDYRPYLGSTHSSKHQKDHRSVKLHSNLSVM